jgi:hypothetical protein
MAQSPARDRPAVPVEYALDVDAAQHTTSGCAMRVDNTAVHVMAPSGDVLYRYRASLDLPFGFTGSAVTTAGSAMV